MVVPNMLYKVRCVENFKDGNMPAGYVTFKADTIYQDIPGSILLRLQRSNPGAFEVLEYKPEKQEEVEKPEPKAKKEK